MFTVKFNSNDARVRQALEEKNAVLLNAVTQKMTFLMTKLQQKVVGETLPRVAARRSGNLAASIQNPRAELSGTTIVGMLDYAGGTAWYGLVFEKGRRGYAVNPLKQATGNTGPGQKRGGTYKKGRGRVYGANVLSWKADGSSSYPPSTGGYYYYPYAFIPPRAATPFMAPALQEMKDEIVNGLRETITGVLLK